jgi:EAL domain-containing protein (putative c-di-GMP-specific phosphodiesterase class I)
MYRAKAQGRARSVLFDPTAREQSPELIALEADLRSAIVRREFRVHYLPIVEVGSGRILGLEALLRWAHPRRGLLAPDQFVPVADDTGLLVPIGRWLLEQAGRDLRELRRGPRHGALTLHVNLSARQLLERDLIDRVDEMLAEHHLEAGALVFEVSEATLQEGATAGGRLAELRAHGIRLSVDDFGSEHSSLAALHRYPLDSLKIDQALFSGGAPRGRAPELVRTIVALARELKTPVVAEGVETAEQADFLRELGCAAAQGFYYSPPLDGAATRELLARQVV